MPIKKKFASTLLAIAGFFDRTHLKLNYWAAQLHLARNSESAQLLEKLVVSGDFCAPPKDASESLLDSDAEFKDAVYLYFLTKQSISLYEAQINYLPLQVYNEMRNALDHYMRAITRPSDLVDAEQPQRRQDHIKKMIGHLQRALLDVIKLTCAAMVEKIDGTHKRLGEMALSLTMDGEYIKQITQLKMNAELRLVNAKLIEHQLGNGTGANVRSAYLEALSLHVQAYKYYQDCLGRLHWGRAKYLTFKGTTLAVTIIGSAIAGYIVRVLWAASEEVPIIKTIIGLIKNIANGF